MFISIDIILFAVAVMNLYSCYSSYNLIKETKRRTDLSDGITFGAGILLSALSIGVALAI